MNLLKHPVSIIPNDECDVLRDFFTSARGLLCITATDGTFHRVNVEWERALGYRRHELEGRAFLDFVHPDDRETTENAFEELLAGGTVAGFENRYRRKDGTYCWLRWTAGPMRDDKVAAMATDVGRERSLLSQLARAQREESIGRLAAGIAHDFNNLLTVMGGYASMLPRDGMPPQQREDLDCVVQACRSAAELTRQLLAFARAQVLEPTYLVPSTVVLELAKMLRRVLGENIELVLELETDDGVTMDRAQLEQVLVNLAVNARDAMADGGRLTIAISERTIGDTAELPSGTYLCIAVEDEGCGMSSETLDEVFEPYFTTKQSRGTGLGLSTAQGIVHQTGGRISVTSRVGDGTRFEILLPVSAPPSNPRRAARSERAEPQAAPCRILAVEDDPAVRAALMRLLRERHEVTAVASVAEATARYAEAPIDLLITDQMLPDGKGTDLIRALRKRQPSLGAVLATGYGVATVVGPEVPSDVLVIRKPFDRDALDRAIERARHPR